MSLLLFYDTETTDKPLFKEPSEDPRQPHLVELAAALVDTTTRRSVASVHMVARPDGWIIPDEVAAIHGITTDYALQVGVPERALFDAFLTLHRLADGRVAHNESFDARIIRIGIKRFGFGGDTAEEVDAFADAFKAATSHCTCFGARPFTALPKNKLPTLSEAYLHFFGEELQAAHSAKADMQACADVFWEVQDQSHGPYALPPTD